jgi:uncharacterized protein YjbI with pentapeptide repeats
MPSNIDCIREYFNMVSSATNYIATLKERCDGYEKAVFAPIDSTGFFDWQISDQQQKENLEGGNAFAFKRTGNLAYATEYLAFMIDRHFNVAYLIDLDSDPKVILLKAWKPGSNEPSWREINNPGLDHLLSNNAIEEKFLAQDSSITLTYHELRNVLSNGELDRWHRWKREVFHKEMNIDLRNLRYPLHGFRGWDFDDLDLSYGYFEMAELSEATFRNARLNKVVFRGAYLVGADFSNANLSGADLHRANLQYAILSGANLQGADLSRADLERADLTSADLVGAKLSGAILVNTNLSAAKLSGCNVHGISAWNVKLQNTIQNNLVITDQFETKITVDNLAMAQFIYVLLNNRNIRSMIETVSSKLVLILGRFTEERKAVLDAVRSHLRSRGYLPVLFDFDKPASRDLTETISALAHLARFVIADITDAKSIPQELMAIVPQLPSVPVQPLLLASQREYAMFEHFRRYSWVLPDFLYDDAEHLLSAIDEHVIQVAETKAREQAKE